MHKGSKETYDFIADFVASDFFFSKKDVWHRMGILGVFADYVCSCTPGAIAEVGVGESSIYLSHVARKYGRNIYHCDLAADKILNPLTIDGYLTIKGEEKRDKAEQPKAFMIANSRFFIGLSDDAFPLITEPLAFTFIDGDHHYEQAKKDFHNAAKLTVDHGYIALHDTYPPSEEYLCPDSKCGDVYRLRQEIEVDPGFDTITLPVGTAMGVGLTICRKKPVERMFFHG